MATETGNHPDMEPGGLPKRFPDRCKDEGRRTSSMRGNMHVDTPGIGRGAYVDAQMTGEAKGYVPHRAITPSMLSSTHGPGSKYRKTSLKTMVDREDFVTKGRFQVSERSDRSDLSYGQAAVKNEDANVHREQENFEKLASSDYGRTFSQFSTQDMGGGDLTETTSSLASIVTGKITTLPEGGGIPRGDLLESTIIGTHGGAPQAERVQVARRKFYRDARRQKVGKVRLLSGQIGRSPEDSSRDDDGDQLVRPTGHGATRHGFGTVKRRTGGGSTALQQRTLHASGEVGSWAYEDEPPVEVFPSARRERVMGETSPLPARLSLFLPL